MGIKHNIHAAIFGSHTKSNNLIFHIPIATLIILNVIAVILETVDQIQANYANALNDFELFSILIFSIEYLTRVWVSNLSPRYQQPITGRLRYIFSPMALMDFLAISPFLLSIAGVDLRVLRVLRLMRLFKLTRYSEAMNSIKEAIKTGKDELILSLIIMIILLLISSTLIYFAEHDAQPKLFSSIPASLWWSVITLTTIGYGDAFPVTGIGKVIGGITAIFGIGMFALPGGIIASGLITNAKKRNSSACPHCGKEI